MSHIKVFIPVNTQSRNTIYIKWNHFVVQQWRYYSYVWIWRSFLSYWKHIYHDGLILPTEFVLYYDMVYGYKTILNEWYKMLNFCSCSSTRLTLWSVCIVRLIWRSQDTRMYNHYMMQYFVNNWSTKKLTSPNNINHYNYIYDECI